MTAMCEQVVLTKMEYAMKSLSLLSPKSLSNCVSVSVSMTQQLLSSPAPKPRPFRINNWNRSVRKGVMADSLEDLMNKVQDALLVSNAITLVLDEDGTGVDTEEYFQSLENGTVFVVLEKGQKWKPCKNTGYQVSLSQKPARRIDVARVSFDFYKMNPRDFIGCVNVKATLYGSYTLSYDLQCYGAKRLMKEALRWALFTMQATGHVLLGSSCYVEQLLDATEQKQPHQPLPSLEKVHSVEKPLPLQEKPMLGLKDYIPGYRKMLKY